MIRQLRNPNFYFIFSADLLSFGLSLLLAYMLRFDFVLKSDFVNQMWAMMLLIIPFKAIVFWGFGLYRGMWRYTGLSDLERLLKACIFSGLCIIAYVIIVYRFEGFSRAVFLMDTVLTIIFCAGLRVGIRLHYQHHQSTGSNRGTLQFWAKPSGKPTLIIGAGDSGERTVRELDINPRLTFHVVGFIDDDIKKQGRTIHDIPVLGRVCDIQKVVEACKIREVLIAVPSATGKQMRRIVEECEKAGVRYRTLPGLGELIDGKVSVKALRDVNYEDLLGRPAVEVDVPEIEGYLKDHCVLVTGAGGSIGSELCRQIVKFNPKQLVLVDVSEENLYNIQMELKHRLGYEDYITVLGSIHDLKLVRQLFKNYTPQIVFHAAAYKHVPMLQRNSWQAVENNITGSKNIMEASINYKVKRFVLVSTDKAVRPTNVMGASKRVCELLMHKYQGNDTKMMGVRFGNVAGSSGSVIPLFRRQIALGGPVTITHPDITRYFMTIREAARLILQAGAFGNGGELFVLEMGTPVKITDLARDLIRLSGKEPDRDIEIEYIGLRPGEKLYEELITNEEGVGQTPHEKILVLKYQDPPNGFSDRQAFESWLDEKIDNLIAHSADFDTKELIRHLKEIVPEYTPQGQDVSIFS